MSSKYPNMSEIEQGRVLVQLVSMLSALPYEGLSLVDIVLAADRH